MSKAQRLGLIGGLLLFGLLLVLPAPQGLSADGWRTAAVAALMATWWMTEAVPIPVTALLPLGLFPLLGILEMQEAAYPYADDLIFLFMGGFFIAYAMERSDLHRRIALSITGAVGTSPSQLILGFMIATAFLSMWISNTATTTMMLPIGMAVGEMLRPERDGRYNFGIALMLGIAYGASIGGVATIIGTPPNAILVGAADEMLGLQIGFVQWMVVGVPITVVFLPIAWFVLTRFLYPPGDLVGDADALLQEKRSSLGSMSRAEKVVGVTFVLTALAWLMRSPKSFGAFTLPGIQTWAPSVGDSTIAILASLVLFVVPISWQKGETALDWETARKIPWGILVLFGGGLSLARAMDTSGLAAWIGEGVGALQAVPELVIFGAVATLFIFLTEITSNTATSTMAMPIMAGVAAGLGMAPFELMAAAALAASMAFMLPVATPPNAIVFGSNYLTIPYMAKAGIWMNILSIFVITLLGSFLVRAILI